MLVSVIDGAVQSAVQKGVSVDFGLAVPVLPWHTDRLRIIDLGTALARVAAALAAFRVAATEIGTTVCKFRSTTPKAISSSRCSRGSGPKMRQGRRQTLDYTIR